MNAAAHLAWREQLGVYTLGQLTGEELRAMQGHVQTCPECQAEVDALAPVAAALRMVDPDKLDEPQPQRPSRSATLPETWSWLPRSDISLPGRFAGGSQ
ncbi:MAG: anti-sigma factor family protein [Pseudonocardiaceae bacterium]